MEILIDTHVLIWYMEGNPKLHKKNIKLIQEPSNTKMISYVSLWEMTVKQSLGKLSLNASPADLIPEAIQIIHPTLECLSVLAKLPYHHRDPFDRMIIAQAISGGFSLMSQDRHFSAYEAQLI